MGPRGPGPGRPQGAAAIIADWSVREAPWAILCRSDTWGREVASRVAARTASGLTGDASSVELDPAGRLVAWKSAAWGATEVPIMTRSATQMVTLRPGAFPILRPRRAGNVVVRHVHDGSPAATSTLQTLTVDQPGRLASAAGCIGLGQGVAPDAALPTGISDDGSLVLRNAAMVDRLRNRSTATFAKYDEALALMRQVGDLAGEAGVLATFPGPERPLRKLPDSSVGGR